MQNKAKSLSGVPPKFFVTDPTTLLSTLSTTECPPHLRRQNHWQADPHPQLPPRAPIKMPHLQLLLPLQGELLEGLDNEASIGAVVDEYGGATHPRLQVVYWQRDVLSVVLEKKIAHVCESYLENSACSPGPAPPRGSHARDLLHILHTAVERQ